jgi:uncharacterized protein
MSGLCPVCAAPVNSKLRPFCSKRCADVDLHRWLTGAYHISGLGTEEDDLDEAQKTGQQNTQEDVDRKPTIR